MKILIRICKSTLVMLIVCMSLGTLKINTFASLKTNYNRQIKNVAVLFHRGNDPYMLQIRKSLEAIEKENPNDVKFTFSIPKIIYLYKEIK